MAFTQNQNVTFVYQPQTATLAILPAHATSPVMLYTGGANGSKVAGSVLASNSDTASHDLQMGINTGGTVGANGAITGGTNVVLGTTTVSAGAGQSGSAPCVNILPTILPVDSDGNDYLFLAAGALLYVAALVAVGAAKQVSIIAPAIGDF